MGVTCIHYQLHKKCYFCIEFLQIVYTCLRKLFYLLFYIKILDRFCQMLFPDLLVRCIVFFLFVFVLLVLLSLIRHRLLKMVRFGMEHVCSSEIIFDKTIFNVLAKSFVSILCSIQRSEQVSSILVYLDLLFWNKRNNSLLHCICSTFFSEQNVIIELYQLAFYDVIKGFIEFYEYAVNSW